MKCMNCDAEVVRGSDFCEACEQKELGKIGGFLYLPALGIILSVISSIYGLLSSIKSYHSVTGITSALYPFIIYQIICFAILLALSVYITGVFFGKKKKAPFYYILLISLNLIFVISNVAISHYQYGVEVDSDMWTSMARTLIGACIWIPYFLVSVRVKRTFVR
ncbi:TPA: DUF2569 domain-containing protein [Serratia fonticola]|uniref:Protein of uncharacterized function (DUF2569) n=1 Tax=Serratia fonticola TaxID=47917 RepID=A0A3S4XP76_SERFO|nr:Protein of uncharacterised function (DUF2569) [Serratia fonticola]